MKKFAFLLSLTLAVGCDSDDDSFLLPNPPAATPAPGELPTQVTVIKLNLQDEVCPDASTLDRNGVLTHVWTNITLYDVSDDEVVIVGDVDITWDNKCTSLRTILGAREDYKLGPLESDLFILPVPDYFGPE